MLVKKVEFSKCLICLLHSKRYDVFEFLNPVQGFCPHRHYNFSKIPQYRLLRKRLILHIFTLIIHFSAVLTYLVNIPVICHKEQSTCILLISDTIFVTGSAIILLYSTVNFKYVKQEMTLWLYLTQSYKWYNIDTIFDIKAIKKCTTNNSLNFILLMTTSIASGLWFIFCYDNLPWNYLRKLSIVLIYVSYVFEYIKLLQRLVIVNTILRSIETQLYKLLTNIKNTKNLANQLKKIQQLSCSVHNTISLLMGFLSIMLIWTFLVMTVSVVFNIFVVIKYVDYDFHNIIIMHGRVLATFITSGYVLLESETGVNDKIKHIRSILFKYPVSKMTPEEMIQVETIITTLIIRKPSFQSNLFVVGTGLLAMISKTIVTYVLVALQFRASWVKL